MGKRVTIKKPKAPQLQIGKLHRGGEGQFKFFAFAVVGMLFLMLSGPFMLIKHKSDDGSGGVPPQVLYIFAWFVVGWFLTLMLAGSHRSKLIKAYPRSKVSGSAHQDLRLQLNQLCRLLDIKRVPDTYVIDSNQVSAEVRGMGAPYMVLSSRLLQHLSDAETTALLAVLLSHVKAKTVRWRTYVFTFASMPGITRLLCAPYWASSLIMQPYIEFSQQAAERVALLLLGGNHKLLITTIVKVTALTSESLTSEQARQLEQFLTKEGVEANAEDVERMYILNQMIRGIPGLRERVESLAATPSEDVFQEQLAIMVERMNRLQTNVRV